MERDEDIPAGLYNQIDYTSEEKPSFDIKKIGIIVGISLGAIVVITVGIIIGVSVSNGKKKKDDPIEPDPPSTPQSIKLEIEVNKWDIEAGRTIPLLSESFTGFNPNETEFYIDGVKQNNYSISHKFTEVGNYTIEYKFNYTLKTCKKMFLDSDRVTSITLNLNSKQVTSTESMFDFTTHLRSINFNNFSTENVITMEKMFYASGVKVLHLSKFNTSKVENIGDIFCNTQIEEIYAPNLDFSKVKSLNELCKLSEELRIADFSGWKTSEVTEMAAAFYVCTALTSLNLDGWDTSKVKDMNFAFWDLIKLKSLNLSSFKTTNVETAERLFTGSVQLNVDCRGFDFSKCNDFDGIFSGLNETFTIKLNNKFYQQLQDHPESGIDNVTHIIVD